MSPADTIAILAHRLLGWPVAQGWPATAETIVMELRLPRVLTALIVGFGLAVAGTTFQGLLRNPLADPYVLGTASGAALGAAIAVVIPVQVAFLGLGLVNLLAFAGALLAVALVLRLAGGGGRATLTTMLLIGYAVGSLLAAGLAMAMYLSGSAPAADLLLPARQLRPGRLAEPRDGPAHHRRRQRRHPGARPLAQRASSSAMTPRSHLGIEVRRERAILLGLASLVTAAAVALAGLIGFVGLVVPHVVRLLVGPNARLVLPLSALFGAAFLILADLVARIPGEIPVGVVTAVVGAPVFLVLLRRFRAGYEL